MYHAMVNGKTDDLPTLTDDVSSFVSDYRRCQSDWWFFTVLISSTRKNGMIFQNYFTSSDPHRDIILTLIFVTNPDILCAKIWRGREGEDNSDEI